MAIKGIKVISYFILLVYAFSTNAQDNLSGLLLEETLRKPSGKSVFQAIWLVPVEFWEHTWPEGAPEAESMQRQKTLLLLKDYALLAAVHATGMMLSVDQIKFTIKGSGVLTPSPYLAISEELQVFLDRTRPMVANVFQVSPEKVSLFLYALPAEIMNSGGYEYEAIVRHQDESFAWSFPPAALLSPGTCPADGKVMNPGWKYCPWHGDAISP